MTLTVPVAAHAEPAGQYSYVCILQNGSSYTLKSGNKLSTCKGSYLKKYINGQQVDSIALSGDGTLAKPLPKNTLDCLIAISGTLISVATLKKGWKSWAGLATSVAGLKSCIA
jgi:hypothetical protein